MGLNPFDQPDVELAKKLTVGRLDSGMKKAPLSRLAYCLKAKGSGAPSEGPLSMIKLAQTGRDAVKALKGFFALLSKAIMSACLPTIIR